MTISQLVTLVAGRGFEPTAFRLWGLQAISTVFDDFRQLLTMLGLAASWLIYCYTAFAPVGAYSASTVIARKIKQVFEQSEPAQPEKEWY